MAMPDYVILDELKESENIYLISKKLDIQDNVFILKYSGSSFLYPEPYYFIRLNDYFELRYPDEKIIEIIMQKLCKICVDYKIHPNNIYEEGVTFNHIKNEFFYPKQLIGHTVVSWEKSAFGAVSQYLHTQEVVNNENRARLQDLITEIMNPLSTKYQTYCQLLQESDENENQDKQMQLNSDNIESDNDENIISPNLNSQNKQLLKLIEGQHLQAFIQQKKEQYENTVIFKYLKSKEMISPKKYDDPDLLNIYKFAYNYKRIGQHKIAKNLFSYYQILLQQINQVQKQLFDADTPEYTQLKIPFKQTLFQQNQASMSAVTQQLFYTNIIILVQDYLKSLSEQQQYQEGLLLCNFQQHSQEWFNNRKMRVTASNFGRIKQSFQQSRNKMVQDQIYPKFFGNIATKYGTETEEKAREQYIKLKQLDGYEVKEFGLLIDEKFIWIGGSPDGLVYQNGLRIGCIEIKCPFTLKDENILDNFLKTGFLEKQNGQLQLKTQHAYYAQCQGIMRLSKVKWCDFVVFTQVDCQIIRVDLNEVYIEELYTQLHQYFFKHLLVENIFPCDSIHVKQQIMADEQFEELEKVNFIIPFENLSKKQGNSDFNYEEKEEKNSIQEIEEKDEIRLLQKYNKKNGLVVENQQDNASENEQQDSNTEPISELEDENIDATIPL